MNDIEMEVLGIDYLIKQARMCHRCFSRNINYGRYYRICDDCGSTLDTSHVIWG